MGITPECKAAMIEHGVLMKDGKPAGMELMNKDVLRIALVEAGEDGRFPENFVTGALKSFLSSGSDIGYLALENAYKFPEGIEDMVKEAIEFWYEGELEFVAFDDAPDIWMLAVGTTGDYHPTYKGKASFPVNDHADERFHSVTDGMSYVSLNVMRIYDSENSAIKYYDKTAEQSVVDTLKHEFGHSFGVIHPHNAADMGMIHDHQICADDDASVFSFEETDGSIMAGGLYTNGDREASDYDEGVRDIIRGVPSGAMKP